MVLGRPALRSRDDGTGVASVPETGLLVFRSSVMQCRPVRLTAVQPVTAKRGPDPKVEALLASIGARRARPRGGRRDEGTWEGMGCVRCASRSRVPGSRSRVRVGDVLWPFGSADAREKAHLTALLQVASPMCTHGSREPHPVHIDPYEGEAMCMIPARLIASPPLLQYKSSCRFDMRTQ